jgi:hypothetical protein
MVPSGLSLSSGQLPISGVKGEEFHVFLFECIPVKSKIRWHGLIFFLYLRLGQIF